MDPSVEISVFTTNSVDQRFTASDLGLHCLPMSLLWDARYSSDYVFLVRLCVWGAF